MFEIENLKHRYGDALVLSIPEWKAAPGEHWLLTGASGSGKTTLLHILAGILRPTQGRVKVNGCALDELSGTALDRFRGRHVGLVPQRLHLVASLSVLDNLRLAQYLAGLPRDEARVREILRTLSIEAWADAKPPELSQGQAQRAAIARAVVNRPRLLLADEPTAHLDDAHCAQVIDLLESQAAACGATLVIATHDQRVRSRIGKEYRLEEQA
ncbi:MAG: ABC transporter ATP-binding protein [Burkholderiales bacterium]|nr:MAG: ABC transporter ATP-binding protein [Burkholderiales bacterium]